MLPSLYIRYKSAARLLLLFLIGLFAILVIPTKLFTTGSIPDKEIHTLIFFCLSVILWLGLRLPLMAQWAVLLILAVLTEWLQNFIPYRDASIDDLLANLLGIALGYGVIFIGVLIKKWRR